MLAVFIIFIVNLLISISNAYGAGRDWERARAAGGFEYVLNWCGAIMSACGFTWCYTLALAGGAYALGKISPHQTQLVIEGGYLIIIPAILTTGLLLTVHSWIQFYRQRDFSSGATALWNTYAQVSNTYDAVTFIPESLGDFFHSAASSDDDDSSNRLTGLVVLLILLALFGGVLTTRYIVLSARRSVAR